MIRTVARDDTYDLWAVWGWVGIWAGQRSAHDSLLSSRAARAHFFRLCLSPARTAVPRQLAAAFLFPLLFPLPPLLLLLCRCCSSRFTTTVYCATTLLLVTAPPITFSTFSSEFTCVRGSKGEKKRPREWPKALTTPRER